MNDKVDDAIASAAIPAASPVQLAQVPVRIASTGRLVVITTPDDLSDVEVIELAAFVLVGLRRFIDDRRGPQLVDALGGRLK